MALIDGVKLNDPSSPGGGFNFGNLLIGNIARIEVLRGAQSVLWGSQAIGGVVNLITRQPTEQLAVNARAEGGWHDTGQAFANVSGKVGPVSASLGRRLLHHRRHLRLSRRARERDGYPQLWRQRQPRHRAGATRLGRPARLLLQGPHRDRRLPAADLRVRRHARL